MPIQRLPSRALSGAIPTANLPTIPAANLPPQISISSSASSGSLTVDTSGRITMPYQPAFKANHNGTGITVSAYTKVSHNREIFDVGGVFDPSNSRFTAPVAGQYAMLFSIIFRGSYSDAWIDFVINGAIASNQGCRHHFTTNTGSTWNTIYMTHVFNLNANDYVEVFNGSLQVEYHGNDWHQWSGYLIG